MTTLNLTVHVWRQLNKSAPGKMVKYQVKGISEHASFLEMLDVLNEQLIERGEEPIAFDHDCREGICGMCSLMINGHAHGGQRGTTTCQLHMRMFKDGDEIFVEPWRAGAFPVLKDLCVDRTAFDKIIAAGGYVTANAGSAPDGNDIPIPKEEADRAFEDVVRRRQAVAPAPPAAGPAREDAADQGDGHRDGRRRFRQLLEPLRVRGVVPEGHQAIGDRRDEPDLRQGRLRLPRREGQLGRRRLIHRLARRRTRRAEPGHQHRIVGRVAVGSCPGRGFASSAR
jgi:hypothetical protein